MTHQRPHYRLVRGKRIRAGRGSVKPRNVTINSAERKVLNDLSDSNRYSKEYGAILDYDKKGHIENMVVIPGVRDHVYIDGEKHSLLAHTHPYKDSWATIPSGDDATAIILDKKEQAEVVVSNGHVFTLIKTPALNKYKSLPERKLSTMISSRLQEYLISHPFMKVDDAAKRFYTKMGFKVVINQKSDKAIKLPIRRVK